MNIPENIYSTLSDEMKKKVEAARSPEELLALAKEAGYELSPDQLEEISGGNIWCGLYCSTKDQCDSHCPTWYDPVCHHMGD